MLPSRGTDYSVLLNAAAEARGIGAGQYSNRWLVLWGGPKKYDAEKLAGGIRQQGMRILSVIDGNEAPTDADIASSDRVLWINSNQGSMTKGTVTGIRVEPSKNMMIFHHAVVNELAKLLKSGL